jgi:hypothetical protein
MCGVSDAGKYTCFHDEGLIMIRFFGFLIAVAGLVSQSNAALLVKYDFTLDSGLPTVSNNNVTSAEVDTGLTIQNDRIETAGLNQTLAQTQSIANFYLGAKVGTSTSISEIKFDATILSGSNSRASLNLFGLIGSFDNAGVFVADDEDNPIEFISDDYTLSTTPTSYSIKVGDVGVTGMPVAVASGKIFQLTVSLYRNGTSISSSGNRPVVALDNVAFSGSAVPEPASMAVFALVGLPVLARRFGRKS